MVSAGAYVAGVLELAVVLGSLVYAATRLRARLLPAWEGAPARLAEAILGVALLVWVGELLGVVGLLREGALVGACALVGLGSTRLGRPGREGDTPPAPAVEPLAVLVAVGVVGVLFAHWGLQTKVSLNNGVGNFDSLWYHLPYAADIAQSGSVTGFHHTETVFLNWFYPQNSESIDASGMLILGSRHAVAVREPRLAGADASRRLVRWQALGAGAALPDRRRAGARGPHADLPRARFGQERRRRRGAGALLRRPAGLWLGSVARRDSGGWARPAWPWGSLA